MITTARAADRPIDRRPASVLLALSMTAALLAAAPLAAERSREMGAVRGSSPSAKSLTPPPSSGSSGGGRTVVPRPDSPPPSGGRDRENAGRGHHGGHGGHGHHGHHGYHHGYYGYPWYPYYGSYWSFYFGYPWGWGPWYSYGGPYYGYRGGYYDEAVMGAMDLDVSPGRTEVYLDGQFLGTVDSFDGWPQYLWLEKGTYDLVLYLDGFRTVARQVTIYPGVVLDVGDRLEPGESVRPEDLATKTHERRDARIAQDREMREQAARDRAAERERTAEQERMEEWREIARERLGETEDEQLDDGREEEPVRQGTAEGTLDVRGEPGRVRLAVEPGDASIYLDGRFIGTGEDIARLHAGLLVDPGEHRVAVVRPGRQSAERDFRVEAGEEVELDIELPAN